MVTAARVSVTSDRLLIPTAVHWTSAVEEALVLEPTPLASQPVAYVINAWTDRPYGLIGQVRVAATHNREALAFRLTWEDETRDDDMPDSDRFTDAAGVLFPLRSDALILTMGDVDKPVNAWYWRSDLEEALSVTATGLGSSVRNSGSSVSATASYRDGRWQVVISRPFRARGDGEVALRPRQTTKVGFAVWQGSNQERAGIKSVTSVWQPLEIEA